jgi:hypothetical protein
MVFNATFNNSSVISCRSVLLVKEIRIHGDWCIPSQTRLWGRRGGDRMLIGFTTTYAISAH